LAGITAYGSYVPFFRVQRAAMGAGKGERAVAGYDEDSVSMAVEAARWIPRDGIDAMVFATTSPPYLEKLNAATIQSALDLPSSIRSLDISGSSRLGVTALLQGADLATAGHRPLVCMSDVVVGAPGGAREAKSGDAAAAFVFGPDDQAIAKVLGYASSTTDVLDTWRSPGQPFVNQWEERFGADVLGPVAAETTLRALRNTGTEPGQLAQVIVDAGNPRAGTSVPKALKAQPEQLADPLAAGVGRAGAAHAGLLLARALDGASPGDRLLVVSVADGCDAIVLEVTEKIKNARASRSVDNWIELKRNDLPYNSYLKWRGILPFEPPRRPDPERPAAPPMHRNEGWKMAFHGSRCEKCGAGHLPPQRVCVDCGAVDQMKQESFADGTCRIATYTIDHLAYTLQPPVVVAVVDFDGGGRFFSELTDVDPKEVKIGMELEMTFRRLYAADGVHNYFWKARPKR
jgi:3-hydroxy-3-methylglutaryl CoA synthase